MKGILEKITKLGPIQVTLLVAAIVIVSYAINLSFLNLLELKSYDLRFRSRGTEKPGREIVIVKIDEESIRAIGRWPWSREHWAKLIERLTNWGATVIGIDAIFAEPEQSPDTARIARFRERITQFGIKDPNVFQFLDAEERIVDADSRLAASINRSGSVVMGYFFITSEDEMKGLKEIYPLGDVSPVLPQALPFRLGSQKVKEIPLTEALSIRSNIEMISEKAKALGFFNVDLAVKGNIDGTVRWVPLAIKFKNNIYPSLALQVLREYLGDPQPPVLKVAEFGVEGIQLGKTFIPTGKQGGFLVNYRAGRNAFPSYSFYKIIDGDVQKEDFAGKIVLVGATATGVPDVRVTPFDTSLPGVEIHATVIDNILRQDFILQPDWIWSINILAIIVMALIPALLITRLSPVRGASISMGLLFIYIVTNWYLLVDQRMWMNLIYPMLAFFGVFVAVTVYQYVTEEREKRKIRSAFQFYVSAGVVEEMLKDPAKLKLGGERKELTVLFSDIKGFSNLSETLPPETLTKLLNLYFTPMTVTVFKYQGTLDKYMGDAIMAIFGAPLEQNDHAEKACHTALDMVEALKALQKSWQIDGIPEISIGIGINTGPMSVGHMGSDVLFDYTVIGDHVNLGSRLEKLNREYGTTIIISEYTHRYLKDTFISRELDIVRVKGRTEPVRIFELLAREEPFHEWSTFKGLFENGLRAYRAQRWIEGIGEFEKALKIRPDDGPAKLYLRRCMLMQSKGSTPKWDGIQIWG
jgi:adenylate cyclase